MRKLKFRAWNKKIKSMGSALPLDVLIYDCTDINYNDLEIMQYTGLKDKNGKEIYEGDVVTKDGGTPTEVIFHNTGFGTHTKSANEFFAFTCWGKVGATPLRTQEIEIIGNIYENQELLKNGQ